MWLALAVAPTTQFAIDHLGLTLEPLPKGLEPASQVEPRERLATLPTIPSATEAAEQSQPGKRRSRARTEEGHFLASPYGGAFTPVHRDLDVWQAAADRTVPEAAVGELHLLPTVDAAASAAPEG